MSDYLTEYQAVRARATYFLASVWLWECADKTCPAIEFADSAAQAGDDARVHMAEHHVIRDAVCEGDDESD